MSVFAYLTGGAVLAAGYAAYQLYKAKKAVTAASVEAQVKADAAVAKSDASKL